MEDTIIIVDEHRHTKVFYVMNSRMKSEHWREANATSNLNN